MRHLVLGFMCMVMLAGLAAADPDHTGHDPDVWFEFGQYDGDRQCTIFYYGDPMGEVVRFTGLGYDVTVGADLSYANISQYDVVVIPLTGPGAIGGYQADIESYVGEGGGLWIHQPGSTTGQLDYAPPGFDLFITAAGFCSPFSGNEIVEPGHPTMTGLTVADLPGRFDTIRTADLGGSYTLIAKGTGSCSIDTHCAGGGYIDGKVFLDTSNLSSQSGDPGSDDYVVNVVEWLCGGQEPTATESSTWGTIKSLYR
ncbi:MAG: hypothetical protein GF355_03130 [Candidatus Eisenbacteria bacterium]|nr:hypothetical protein [Candidatus Eisenbacteria bacterium]